MKRSDIQPEYDLVIAGGGITGAGIFNLAVKKGYKALLVEADDFAWGTSGRSSKMVHGGLRYLKQGRFLMTRAAVKERERLLKRYPGLVTPLPFIMPVFDHYGPSRSAMTLGLSLYSLMAGKKQHRTYTPDQAIERIPFVRQANLVSAVGFQDGQVDDARLVLRLIFDACRAGGNALNYMQVVGVERNRSRHVAGVNLTDKITGKSMTVKTKAVINATGAWAEKLQPSPVKGYHIRPLRGSHLVFPGKRLPIDRVISFIHPRDLRPVFLFPWEGSVFLGTTDVDHDPDDRSEPVITRDETDYLMEGLAFILPGTALSLDDCTASMAGVRPVLSRKKKAASKESREHVIWADRGLVTATGGKLTTFRLLALAALKKALPCLPEPGPSQPDAPGDDHRLTLSAQSGNTLSNGLKTRIFGRYGTTAGRMILNRGDDRGFETIGETSGVWAELCHAAEYESVYHLSDLMLRRTRIGLFLPDGGSHLLDRVESLCRPFLPWDTKKWTAERKKYIQVWQRFYSPPKTE